MFQRCSYADAFSDLEDADFVVIGLPFDSTASFRSGSREGPDAVRLASYNFEGYDYYYDVDLADLLICDLGNMDLGSDPSYAWETIKEGLSTLPRGVVPVLLGGEHSITPPVVEHFARQGSAREGGTRHDDSQGNALQSNSPHGDTRKGSIGILVLDAHLDLRDEYGCTKYSHACTSRRILEAGGLSPSGYASIGIRSGSREEFAYAEEKGISYFTSFDVKERGIDAVLDEVMQNMKCDRLYLSLDMDVIDPGFAPGVGNPEPFGLTPWDVRRVIERIGPAAVGMDINEITPAYDRGETALLGARLVREFIASKGRYLEKLL